MLNTEYGEKTQVYFLDVHKCNFANIFQKNEQKNVSLENLQWERMSLKVRP